MYIPSLQNTELTPKHVYQSPREYLGRWTELHKLTNFTLGLLGLIFTAISHFNKLFKQLVRYWTSVTFH